MEEVFKFVAENWEFLSAVLGILLGWLDARKQFNGYVDKAREEYLAKKQWAKSKDLHQAAKVAYGAVSKLARKTENTLDDKAARGLEVAIGYMEHLGWTKEDVGNGERDIILKIFDALHEDEHLQLEAAHGAPVSNKASSPGQVAAPLVTATGSSS